MMTVDDKMRKVLELAEYAMQQGELPIAAAVFHGDVVIAQAYATEKKDGRFLIHAEIKALLQMDEKKYPIKARREMQLFTNLEPCMMCFGAAIHSFVGEVYYSVNSLTDGGALWAKKSWSDYHISSTFQLPKIYDGILVEESKALFQNFLELHPNGGLHDWVKTLV